MINVNASDIGHRYGRSITRDFFSETQCFDLNRQCLKGKVSVVKFEL